jgi:hypothetical protein
MEIEMFILGFLGGLALAFFIALHFESKCIGLNRPTK